MPKIDIFPKYVNNMQFAKSKIFIEQPQLAYFKNART